VELSRTDKERSFLSGAFASFGISLRLCGRPHETCGRLWRTRIEKSDHRHPRLVRAGGEGQCGRCAAEKCDEFSSSHWDQFRVDREINTAGSAARLPLMADCVAKVPNRLATSFREKTKQAAIVDGYGVKFVSEVACEFIAVR
jgi:hypothetical protein